MYKRTNDKYRRTNEMEDSQTGGYNKDGTYVASQRYGWNRLRRKVFREMSKVPLVQPTQNTLKETMNLSTTSEEYASKLANKPIGEPMIPQKDQLNSIDPLERIYRQTNPIAPVRSSKNWATEEPSRGFDNSDLNTYIVRPADYEQVKLFDRYILGQTSELFNRDFDESANLGTMMLQRLQKQKVRREVEERTTNFGQKRVAYQNSIRGANYGNISQMTMAD